MSEELTPLEALEELKKVEYMVGSCYLADDKRLEIIEKALNDSEWYKRKMIMFETAFTEENAEKLKLKQILEIIVKKKVDVWKLYDAINISADAWKGHELHFYNGYMKHPNDQYRKLTEEEFNLLKEIILDKSNE